MSIFSMQEDKPLKGDHNHRRLKDGALDFENYKNSLRSEEIFEHQPSNLWVAYSICLIVFLVLIGQLLRLQIAQGAFNKTLAEGNRIRAREIMASRGLIYDSKGKLLAKNSASFDFQLYPLDLPRKKNERAEILNKISEISGIPYDELESKVQEKGFSSYDPIVLKENVDRDAALLLETKTANLPGVVIAKRPIREYVGIRGISQIVGYVGKMNENDLKKNPSYKTYYEIGKDGLESYYEKYLRGEPGISEIEVDSSGREQRELKETSPEPGNNLILSINAGLQDNLTLYLEEEIKSINAPGGAAIAIDPKSGQILALSSVPTYDNNIFSQNSLSESFQKLLDDPAKPLFNRVVSGAYPSGSIVKPFVAASSLQEGIISVYTTINDPGEIKVGNYAYPDWKVHGYVDVRKAIAVSCNVFFYSLAGGWDKIKGLGIAKLDDYLSKFNFGAKTNIDLQGEVSGLVPSPSWKEKTKKEMWYLGDTYHLGIGQGDFLVTPLQMAVAYSAIANGGEILRPQLVAKITDKDDNTIYTSQKEIAKANFISNENLQIVREGMRLAVTGGSSQLLNDLSITAAAKTGTAQFGAEGKTHAWMASFAPYNDPQIVIIVLVEEGGEGYASAGPVVKRTLDWYFANK